MSHPPPGFLSQVHPRGLHSSGHARVRVGVGMGGAWLSLLQNLQDFVCSRSSLHSGQLHPRGCQGPSKKQTWPDATKLTHPKGGHPSPGSHELPPTDCRSHHQKGDLRNKLPGTALLPAHRPSLLFLPAPCLLVLLLQSAHLTSGQEPQEKGKGTVVGHFTPHFPADCWPP